MKYPNYTGTEPCAQIGMDFYFNEPTNGIYIFRDLLKATCNECPMLVQCRTWALHHEEYGWWGGTTPRERVSLRKELGIKFEPLMRAS